MSEEKKTHTLESNVCLRGKFLDELAIPKS